MNELIAYFDRIASKLELISETVLELEGLGERLDRIEEALENGQGPPSVKPFVTPKELAEISVEHGAIKYSYYTLRQACNHGKIVGAYKQPHNNQWLIPQDSAKLILSEGLSAD